MEIDRRDFIKLGAIATVGLIPVPNNVISAAPMKITTSFGKLLFDTVKWNGLPNLPLKYHFSPLSEIPPEYTKHKVLMKIDGEFVKTKGMEFLISNPKITNEQRMDVRDAEVVGRVIAQANLIATLGDKYPHNWTEAFIKLDLFHYLIEELESLNPDNKDFTEDYTKELTKQLVKAIPPSERFNLRINQYHTHNNVIDEGLSRASRLTAELY